MMLVCILSIVFIVYILMISIDNKRSKEDRRKDQKYDFDLGSRYNNPYY